MNKAEYAEFYKRVKEEAEHPFKPAYAVHHFDDLYEQCSPQQKGAITRFLRRIADEEYYRDASGNYGWDFL